MQSGHRVFKLVREKRDENAAWRTTTMSDEEFNSRNAALKPTEKKEEASQLMPEEVDFHISENRENHHTADYNIDNLIVRRGKELKLTVTFDRPFDAKQDQLILQLTFGNRPKESKSSLIRVKETKQLSTSSWGMRIDGSHGNTVSLTVKSPAYALVGEYTVFVETKTKKSASGDEYLTFRKKLDETFIVLFNAWCKDDAVYMENDEHRQEYVMNDHGRIWVGNKRNYSGIPWYFGQFEDVSLKSCLYILDICKDLKATARGNPVFISRAVTQMVNNYGSDSGILVGNWTGDYKDGDSPLSWSGSVAILKKYFSDKPKDGVKYGQCWVFSGLVTTILRAIGIPTRSVTNFASAHDTDASMTIDFHYDKEGEPMKELNDSVWNFHVWNESFFTRPDLPPGYGGWQAIDATPQELSQGAMRCGPCSIKAIKQGEVYLPYDCGFLFAEVNGDRVYWQVDENGEMKVIDIDKYSVGKNISTKAVGNNIREDVTDYYKHNEGSSCERSAVFRANAHSSRRNNDIYELNMPTDVMFDFVPPDDDLIIGSDFKVQLKMKNTSNEPRTIKYSLITKKESYTGITVSNLNKRHDMVVLQQCQEKVESLDVLAADYLGKGHAEADIQVYLKATVQETKQEFNEIETIGFKKPDIQAKFYGDVIEKKKFKMTLYFKNPLGIPLENGVFNIESSRYVSPDTIAEKLTKPVKPDEIASVTVTFEAERRGWREVIAKFSSDQLSDVAGEIWFKVKW